MFWEGNDAYDNFISLQPISTVLKMIWLTQIPTFFTASYTRVLIISLSYTTSMLLIQDITLNIAWGIAI